MISRKYFPRIAEKLVLELSEHFKAVMVTGARQVGKSTMLQRCGADRKYVTLDDPMIRALANEDPELFLRRYEPPVTIDEIQYAPCLFPYIKIRCDASEERGLYWLTGSQHFSMMMGVSESLAGRVAVINLKTLSYSETLGRENKRFVPGDALCRARRNASALQDVRDVFKSIWRGSYPQLLQDEGTSKEVFYSSYVQTYMERDVRQLADIGSEIDFLKFMKICAARIGSMLNFSALAADAGVSIYQARKWFSVLMASDLVFTVEPYFENRLKRVVKSPKFYFSDTGLCSYLASWNSPEALEDGAMSGEYFENYVINEIIKSYSNCGMRPPISYYRDKDKKEIDLIVEADGKLYPIEIKKTMTPKKDMIGNFGVLPEDLRGDGALVCRCQEDVPLTRSVSAVPVWYI